MGHDCHCLLHDDELCGGWIALSTRVTRLFFIEFFGELLSNRLHH